MSSATPSRAWFSKLIMAALILFFNTVIGCGTNTHEPTRPPEPSTDELCVSNAKAKIAASGQHYPQWGPDRAYVDVLLGGQWLRVPSGYLLLINPGYSANEPGLLLDLQSLLPDLKPYVEGDELRRKPWRPYDPPANVRFFLGCGRVRKPGTFELSITKTKEEILVRTETAKYRYQKLRVLDDLGLEEWGQFGTERLDVPSMYFPLDPTYTHPYGRIVAISCGSRDMNSKYRVSCRAGFGLPERGIGVEYDFPLQQLKHWRKMKEFAEQIVNTMIQDGDRFHGN